jgi:hypothetical protein
MANSRGPNPWILRAPPATAAAAASVQELAGGRGQHAAPPPVLPASGAAANYQLSLFCFAPAGSSASVYHGWEQQLPAAVEVRPTLLPACWRCSAAVQMVHAAKLQLACGCKPTTLSLHDVDTAGLWRRCCLWSCRGAAPACERRRTPTCSSSWGECRRQCSASEVSHAHCVSPAWRSRN